MMTARRTIAALTSTAATLLLTAGCYTAEIQRLEDQLTATRAELARERDERCDEDRRLTDSGEKLAIAWTGFEESYDPEVRQQLSDNLEVSWRATQELERLETEGGEDREAIAELEDESAELRDATVRHEAEARASNIVNELRSERALFQDGVNRSEGAAVNAAHAASDARSRIAASAKSADRAASSARQAQCAAENAATASDRACREVRGLRHRVACLETANHALGREVVGLRARVNGLAKQVASSGASGGRRRTRP